MRHEDLTDKVHEALRYFADEHVPLARNGVKHAGKPNLLFLEALLHDGIQLPLEKPTCPQPLAAPYHMTHAKGEERRELHDYLGVHGIVLPEEMLATYPLLRTLANYVEWKTVRQDEYRAKTRR